jgi:hypothetical protein
MSKDQAMKMYVRELQQMIETMPESDEVETFKNLIGPFYEDSTGVGFKQGEVCVIAFLLASNNFYRRNRCCQTCQI